MRIVGPIRDLRRDRSGAAAVEFALVITVFLMVVLGVIELGRYAMMQQALSEAVHNGGRYAVVHGSKSSSPATTASLQTLVENNSTLLTPSQMSVSVTFSPNNTPGSTVSIVGTYPWKPLIPMLKLPSATLTAKSVATILN